jgi:hypothetical protein
MVSTWLKDPCHGRFVMSPLQGACSRTRWIIATFKPEQKEIAKKMRMTRVLLGVEGEAEVVVQLSGVRRGVVGLTLAPSELSLDVIYICPDGRHAFSQPPFTPHNAMHRGF